MEDTPTTCQVGHAFVQRTTTTYDSNGNNDDVGIMWAATFIGLVIACISAACAILIAPGLWMVTVAPALIAFLVMTYVLYDSRFTTSHLHDVCSRCGKVVK